jgi:hypothetical protein
VFADLNRYEATTRFNGQSTVMIDSGRTIMIASLRDLDTFAKIDGSWYFAERNLLLDWSETRPSRPGT